MGGKVFNPPLQWYVNNPPSKEGGFKMTPYKGALVTVHLQVAVDISL